MAVLKGIYEISPGLRLPQGKGIRDPDFPGHCFLGKQKLFLSVGNHLGLSAPTDWKASGLQRFQVTVLYPLQDQMWEKNPGKNQEAGTKAEP